MSQSGMIRNVQQSVQYRDVTKQAPDLSVFIDGQNSLINPYLGEQGVPVQFNNYISSFSASYDVESLIPSGSLTLTVPIQWDYLFRIPGGNYILKTMAQIKVFMKGAYLSPRGNSVYWQVFNGVISSINYAQNGKTTTISLSLQGVLMMLEKMQIELSPAIMSSAAMEVTPYSSTNWNLNPYQMLGFVFLYSSMLDGFTIESLQQSTMNKSNPLFEAVQANYVAKWQALLYSIAQDTHIFGCPDPQKILAQIRQNVKKSDDASQNQSKDTTATARDTHGALSASQDKTTYDFYYEKIKNYMPDMSFGNIQLLNGRVVSRLERLRFVVDLIGFEAYQDIDGSIIIKPPCYNLDVTVVGAKNSNKSETSYTDLYDDNNPFIVQLSEIISESESEDEAAVRLTRMTARGNINPAMQLQGTETFIPVIEDIDIPKLAQFGLRTEEAKQVGWFTDSDTKSIFGYVASELVRANRGFRTYTFTIPARAELKIGFPMYIPHKDMYGSVKNVSVNYTQGSGAATMTVVLDNLRRRPMFPVSQQVVAPNGTQTSTVILTTQPNLVLRWTTPSTPVTSNTTATGSTSSTSSGLNTPVSKLAKSEAQLDDTIATLPLPEQQVVDQEIQALHYRKNKIGNSYGTETDTTSHNWRVQPDTQHSFDSGKLRPLSPTYLEDLRTTRPYTDDKGYELIGPFPWGRWRTLRDCIYDFTIANTTRPANGGGVTQGLNPAIQPVLNTSTTLTNAQAFMFTGDGTPSSTPDAATQTVDALVAQTKNIGNTKVFELTYNTSDPTSIAALQSIDNPGSEIEAGLATDQASIDVRTATFVTGQVQPTNTTLTILSSITPEAFTPSASEEVANLNSITAAKNISAAGSSSLTTTSEDTTAQVGD